MNDGRVGRAAPAGGMATVVALGIVVAAAALVSTSAAEPKKSEEAAERAALIAVKFHADWCGSCKAMGSRFEDLRNKLDTEAVLFVTLDLTTQSSRKQAEYMTAALGLGGHWPTYGGKTGFILLIDPATNEVVEVLTKRHDLKQMVSAIDRAIGDGV